MYTDLEAKKKAVKENIDIHFLLQQLNVPTYKGGKFITSILSIEDKDPSMFINPEQRTFYCYSKLKTIDVITFYRLLKKVDFKTAVEDLYYFYTIQKKNKLVTNNQSIKKVVKNFRLKKHEVKLYNQLVDDFLKQGLSETKARLLTQKEIKKIRRKNFNKVFEFIRYYLKEKVTPEVKVYLKSSKRKLKPSTISNFEIIGVSEPQFLFKALLRKFSKEVLMSSGLFNDKMRFIFWNHRIIIPYRLNGRVTYLRARKYPDIDGTPKYLGLSGFSSKRIFNREILSKLKKNDDLYICEGEFDTMIATQIGLSAIGIPGTGNINFPILRKLKITNYNLYIISDNDEAGDKMAQNISDYFKIPVKRVSFDQSKDLTEAYNG